MPELSRSQIFVYAALAVVALLLGSRWIRGQDAGASPGPVSFDSGGGEPAGESGSLAVTAGAVVVHVAGEVHRPGVYRMPDGSRVTDALERAGGVTNAAVADAINLAAPLADGQQVTIPARVPKLGEGGAVVPAAAGDDPINLGTATVEQLDSIEGIGPVTAANILAFRDERGGVSSIDDLDEISGIGPATMEALRARLQP